jgi:hypothetical protein
MTRVAKFEKADETIPICIIGLEAAYTSTRANVGRFDFGICMAAFNGLSILKTDEFSDDQRDETFTLHRADNLSQFSYSMSRFKKITAGRYGGWSLVVPDDFEDLAEEYALRQHFYRDGGILGLKGIVGKNELTPKPRAAA